MNYKRKKEGSAMSNHEENNIAMKVTKVLNGMWNLFPHAIRI